jgi:hypothetical protein
MVGPKFEESAADIEVAEHLAGLGLNGTVRLVRGWRDVGLLPKARLIKRGYGRLDVSENVPGTLERAVEIARARGGKRTNHDKLVLRLFLRGVEVGDDLIHASLVRVLDWYIQLVESGTQGARDSEEAVDDLSSLLMSPKHLPAHIRAGLEQPLKGQSHPSWSRLGSAITVFATVFEQSDFSSLVAGEMLPLSSDDPVSAIDEMRLAMGMVNKEGRSLNLSGVDDADRIGSDIRALLLIAEACDLSRLRDLAERVALDELVLARSLVEGAISFTAGAPSVLAVRNDAIGEMARVIETDERDLGFILLLMVSIVRLVRQRLLSGSPAVT